VKARPDSGPIDGLVAAESLSLLGNQIAAVAIPILVLQFTESPLVTGIASAGNVLPILLAALVGGRAIDRLGAWNMSVASDLLSCLSVLLLPLAFLYMAEVPPLLLFLLVVLGALFDPTGMSARQTLVPALARIAERPLERINSLRGGLENGADFLGPLAAVALISIIGTVNAFFVNAATFLLSAIIFAATVPRPPSAPAAGPPEAGEGVLPGMRFVFRHPSLRAVAVMGIVSSFVILPFLGLLLPVVTMRTFDNIPLLGVCLSAFGLAATLGAALFSRLARKLSRSAMLHGGLALTGAAIILSGLASEPYQLVLAAALAGSLLGAGNPLQQTVLQEETPPTIAGQVFTAVAATNFAAGPLGLLVAGALAEWLGAERVLVMGGAFLLCSALIGWRALPVDG
jgi:MFS family permease